MSLEEVASRGETGQKEEPILNLTMQEHTE